jgi:hypothetical protein
LTPEQQKEELSKAYVGAVAAACGYAVGTWTQDHDCIDTTLSASLEGKPKLDLQLKATSQARIERAEHFSWQLDNHAHYEALRRRAIVPHFFVLLVLPPTFDLAVEHTLDHLMIRRCAFWMLATGLPESTADKPTLFVPKTQVFSPQALRGMMATAQTWRGVP